MFDRIDDASDIVLNKLLSWRDSIVSMFPNFVIAIIVVLIFYGLSRLIRKLLQRVLHRFVDNKSAIDLFLAISSIIIMLIGMMIALSVMDLSKTVTSVLAGIGVLGLALGLAFQDAASNLISGIFMAFQSPISVGDIIETNDILGTVKQIHLRSTTIFDPRGQDVIIPNRTIFQNIYRHYNINRVRRIDLECGISYGDNLRKVREVSIEAISKVPTIKKDREVEFFFTGFGDSSINFVVRYWIDFKRIPDYMTAQSEGVILLKEAFDQNGITIPFPIRTLDFGIKGGKTLATMFPDQK
ncbi:mechanosensitive ion channel family protein [Fulvivirga sedimenti]|uniref:Mechanosensitive ion channel n=1 Tax=Fulvivirga sedimenti TaxID=2879465 RepID=A0A9X1HNK2_9BACT|nr:mechanosensitive ion channel family protein [Fulvivirga sedimenti]MCA6073267.1 mechanosensitive ion channel [Fulvivirga sedimenti]